MFRVDAVDNDDKARLAPAARTALRSFPRTLREDLCTLAADPLPRITKVRWLAWLPHVIVVWLSIPLFLANSDELENRSGLGAQYGLLLAAFQSGALILAMFRPVPAWWLSLVPTLVVAVGEPRPDDPWPWPVTGVLAHAGVLLLLSLRVRPGLRSRRCCSAVWRAWSSRGSATAPTTRRPRLRRSFSPSS